jgi:hypothetical protein
VILDSEHARSLARWMRRWDPGDMPIDEQTIDELLAAGAFADRALNALTGEEPLFWGGAPINALTASALLFAVTLTCPRSAGGKHQLAVKPLPVGLAMSSPEPAGPSQRVCLHCGSRADILRGVSAWARTQQA